MPVWTRVGGAAVRNKKDHFLELQRRVHTAQPISKWKCGRRVEGMMVNAKSESGGLGRTHQWRQDAWRMRAGKNRWCIQIVEWCVALHFWSEFKYKKRCRFEYHRNQDDSWIWPSEVIEKWTNLQDWARWSLRMSTLPNPPPTKPFMCKHFNNPQIRKLDTLAFISNH